VKLHFSLGWICFSWPRAEGQSLRDRASRAFSRQVFERFPRKRWGKCASFATSARDPLESNVCSSTVGIMVSYPSPTSRSGRRLGIRRRPRWDVMRDVVQWLIARAVALGRRGLGSRGHELTEDHIAPTFVTRSPETRAIEGHAGVSPRVPSQARPNLVGMDRTPHLTGVAGASDTRAVLPARPARGTPAFRSRGFSSPRNPRTPRTTAHSSRRTLPQLLGLGIISLPKILSRKREKTSPLHSPKRAAWRSLASNTNSPAPEEIISSLASSIP
jgi:hypothetical protein